MIRARRAVALLLAAAVLAGCTLETMGAIKGDDRYFARFDDVQELTVGHTVRISDVNIGTVLGIELDGYEAVVEFTIENGRTLVEGTTASIAVTSLLGENFVALQLPGDTDGPPLEPGSTLTSGSATATVEQLAVELLTVTRAVQGRDVAAIIEAGATGLGSRGRDLNTLIDTVASVTDNLAAQSAAFDALLTDLDTVVSTLAPVADDLATTIDLAADATGTLASQRERIVTTVEDLTNLARTLDDEVLAPHRQRLTAIIDDLQPFVAQVTDDRDRLIRIIDQLVVVTQRVPTAINHGNATAYAWVDEFHVGDLSLVTTVLGTTLRELLLGAAP